MKREVERCQNGWSVRVIEGVICFLQALDVCD